MALILLFKVMVALSVLLWYGASVLRFVNEYFYSQFRKQLVSEYRQHPEMRNLDLDGFHDVTQFPGDDNTIADGKRGVFVVDSATDIKHQKQRSLLSSSGISLESSSRTSNGYDNLKKHNVDSESSMQCSKQGDEGERRKKENAFPGFESSVPDHYYSILRSSQSGGHGRDQKPQSAFSAPSTAHVNSERISISRNIEEKATATDNNDVSAEFTTTTRKDPQEETDYRQNFYPTRDDDYNDDDDEYDFGADRGESRDHSFPNHYFHSSDSSSCDGLVFTSSADLTKEYDPNILWNDDGYYCSAVVGESEEGVANRFKSDYYYGEDFQDHEMVDAYTEFHKYVQEQMPSKWEEHEIHYYEDSTSSSPSPAEAHASTTPLYENVMDSSSSILLSNSSSFFFIFLLSNLCAVKFL